MNTGSKYPEKKDLFLKKTSLVMQWTKARWLAVRRDIFPQLFHQALGELQCPHGRPSARRNRHIAFVLSLRVLVGC